MSEFVVSTWSQLVALVRTFRVTDLIDIVIVALLLYKLLNFVKETRTSQLVKGLLVLGAVTLIVKLLNLRMMDFLLSNIFQVGIFALVVVFQPELRKFLEQLGRSKLKTFKLFSFSSNAPKEEALQTERSIRAVVDGCMILRNMKMGALIVFERNTKLGEIAATGTQINAAPSPELVGNIFFNKAPLHDGAMIIKEGMILAAGCILPLTQDETVSSELGTRHRAALGMSEVADAVVVVISEETGNISVAINGHLVRNYTKDTLTATLKRELIASQSTEKKQVFSSLKASKRKENKNG